MTINPECPIHGHGPTNPGVHVVFSVIGVVCTCKPDDWGPYWCDGTLDLDELRITKLYLFEPEGGETMDEKYLDEEIDRDELRALGADVEEDEDDTDDEEEDEDEDEDEENDDE